MSPAARTLPWILCALAGAMAAVNAFTLPVNDDEFQYLAAARLLQQGLRLYSDFLYSQTPYFPQSLTLWLALFPDPEMLGGVHVQARIYVLLWSLGFLAGLAWLLQRLSPHAAVSAFLFLAVFASGYIDLPMRLVRNDMPGMALTVSGIIATHAALRAALAGRPRDRRAAGLFALAGLLFSLAGGFKQSFAFIGIALFLWSCLFALPGWRRRLAVAALPVALGGLLGLLPVLPAILPDIERFRFSVFDYHRTAHVKWVTAGGTAWPLRWQIASIGRAALETPAALLALSVAGFALLSGRARLGRFLAGGSPEMRLAAFSVLALGFIGASEFLAKPSVVYYFAPLLPFLATLSACLARLACGRGGGGPESRSVVLLSTGLGAVILLSAFEILPHHLRGGPWSNPIQHFANVLRHETGLWQGEERPYLYRIDGREIWLPQHLASVRAQFQAVLPHEAGGAPVKIATILNSYPVATGYGLYPELASAPFFFRSNHYFDPELIHRMNGVSPTEFAGWLEAQGAVAILSRGERGEAGEEILGFARQNGFLCYRIDLLGAWRADRDERLYVDPGIALAPPTCETGTVPADSAQAPS